jgi:hypothetical protein
MTSFATVRSVAVALMAVLPALAFAKSKKPPAPAPEIDDKPPVITHVRVQRAPLGDPIIIRARISDEGEIFAPAVYARPEGKGEFESFGMKHIGDGWEATIPPSMTKQNVEYFIEAFDDQGNGPAREGSPDTPIKIVVFDPVKEGVVAKAAPSLGVVPKDEAGSRTAVATTEVGSTAGVEEDDSIATKWWFWTIIGVAVTAGIATTVVLLQSGGKVESVDVQVRGPDPARGL